MRALLTLPLLLAAQSATAHDFQSFASDGCNIAYTDYGTGDPVIFLHGFSADFDRNFTRNADALSKEFRIIGIDERGHGRSDKPHDVEAYGKHFATDVVNLMDRLHIERAQVVGHSMGGVVSMYLAANDPGRFQSAVTIGNGLFHHSELSLISWLMRGLFTWNHVKDWFGADAGNHIPNDEAALVAAVRSLSELTVSEEQAAALKVPVLAMRGGPQDDPHDTVERLVAVNPSVEMIRIEPEDHFSILANEKFQQELRAFLSRPTNRPRASSAYR
jgi:pimeloyl-ACP methyl ester carboxylesterase